MKELTCFEVVKAVNGVQLSGPKDAVFKNISTDTRKIKKGELFIPLIGENFDGHEFIEKAFEKGAAGVLTQKMIQPDNDRVIIRVEDTKKALGSIAAYYRSKFSPYVVAITGSVGKTSTKDIVASALAYSYNVLKTEANYNNEIGLPLTLLKLDDKVDIAVLEMGMRGQGEIRYLTNIVKPNAAIITNIGLAHIERLGSQENILKANLEITEGLQEGGTVILNGDDPLLYGMKGKLNSRIVYFGINNDDVEYKAININNLGLEGIEFDIIINDEKYKVKVPSPGIHNVYNALAAFAVGMEVGQSPDKIIKGILNYKPTQMRLDVKEYKGITIINDAYNANPQSMEAAIKVLKDISKKGRAIAVLGDMLEMGEYASKAHFDIGSFAFKQGIDYVVTVGEKGKLIAKGAVREGMENERVYSFDDNEEAGMFLRNFAREGDCILVKGSRGMKMEEVIEVLTYGEL